MRRGVCSVVVEGGGGEADSRSGVDDIARKGCCLGNGRRVR